MKVIITLFLNILLLGSCKCYYYYTNGKQNAMLKETLFSLESRINAYPGNEIDQLEVAIYYGDSSVNKIIRQTIRIYPIVKEKDTLKMNNEYASHYYYNIQKKWPDKVNIQVQFDIDSSGTVLHKSFLFKDLVKEKDCEARFVPH
jgi:hypothetical protein